MIVATADRMNEHTIVTQFSTIGESPMGRRRSPQKPLLVLLAIARGLMAKPRLAPFEDIEPVLTNLLKQFAERGRSSAAEAFWRLQEDGIWEVGAADGTPAAWKKKRPTSRGLIIARATGGLSESLDGTFRHDASLALRVMSELLVRNFSPKVRDAVASALGVPRHPVNPEIVDPDVTGSLLTACSEGRDPRSA